ncbi:MAG TPA: LptF/LptG family permease, partial [Gemmatimonadaceae bacterium]
PNNTVTQGLPPNSADLAAVEVLRIRLQDTATLMNSYGVEIHKKFALAVACFVFVLLGAPIALRFPRGGVGLTICVSLFVFALYYVCLIAGESIAKRGLMPAVVSMWMANVIFSLVALWMLMKMGQEGTTARGGDMSEMIGAIKGSIRAKLAWKKRREARARLAA